MLLLFFTVFFMLMYWDDKKTEDKAKNFVNEPSNFGLVELYVIT